MCLFLWLSNFKWMGMAIPFWLRKYVLCFSSERQILDLIWNLPALDVRHVPEWGYCTSNLWQKCPLYGCYAMGRLIAWEIHYRPYKIFVFFGDSQTGFVTPKVPRHPKALFSKSVIFWQRSFGSPQCHQKMRVIFYFVVLFIWKWVSGLSICWVPQIITCILQ